MKKIKTLGCLSYSLLSLSMAVALQAKEVDLDIRVKSFELPENMTITPWANNDLVENPSFFYFDAQGRMLLVESKRMQQGVLEVRRFSKNATIDDIKIKTLDDRLALYEKYKDEKGIAAYIGDGTVSDDIKLLVDSDEDGVADKVTMYATGFTDVLDGLGSGVIERDGKVYYTNIPHLWQLEDKDNDGVSDQRVSLQNGFGTRVSFMGHDMHGLAWGPDGRLYWSLGDRGYDIKTKEGKHFSRPNFGAIFRSDPDGSNIEEFYIGLRNPQELVFDEYGNLFTADNDGDKGDHERINHIIEGGDSGWHAGHQSIMSFTQRFKLRSAKYTGDAEIPVTWLVNDMSLPRNDKQPAFILPSIGQLNMGPSGFTYNPTNYLGEEWRKSFFVAHYGGQPTASHITSFKNNVNGASFLTSPIERIFSGMNVADIDFGPDGRFYISEFNFGGWEADGTGAVYTVDLKNTPADLQKTNQQYQQLLTSDFSKKSVAELTELLSIDHQTIRQRAQFALAAQGASAYNVFNKIALDTTQEHFARIHSIWGISQLIFTGKVKQEVLTGLLPLLTDGDKQVRNQVARVLGDHGERFSPISLQQGLVKALNDDYPQVVMYAAIALGKMNAIGAIPTIVEKIKQNADQDLWLRHAYTMAFKGIDKKHWIEYRKDPHQSVRMAVLLTLRLLSDDDVAYFLNDQAYPLVREAAVAIDDKALTSVRGKMAARLDASLKVENNSQAYLHHRFINANFNQGTKADALRLLKYATTPNLNDRLVAEALAAIEGWYEINPIDSVTGLPTLANTQRDDISELLNVYIPKVLANAKDKGLVQAYAYCQ